MSALTQARDHARVMAKQSGPDEQLWTQIADEIDDYLSGPEEHVDLFGDTTVEPDPTDPGGLRVPVFEQVSEFDFEPKSCGRCQWVEVRTLAEDEPTLMLGRPCQEHA